MALHWQPLLRRYNCEACKPGSVRRNLIIRPNSERSSEVFLFAMITYMQIIVIRHAQTEYNKKELINGNLDDDHLSAEGLAQIPVIIDGLAPYTFDALYTSPMYRSIQTAEPIAKHFNITLRKDSRLIEINLGSFQGQSWDATIPDFGVNSSKLLSSCEYDFSPYGGESADETRLRVQNFIDDLKKDQQQKPLIVCHGGIMRWFYYLCTGSKAGRIPNASVHMFEI